MPLKELIKMFLTERLDIVIKDVCTEDTKKIIEQGERIINDLPDQDREVCQAYDECVFGWRGRENGTSLSGRSWRCTLGHDKMYQNDYEAFRRVERQERPSGW